ncbi:Methyltransferase domain-containing protein [Sporobacter termitidis DSM 10068]|uniref:Methyltransferase domain-containing protein n=1 Tax=Sporobacter termitidis DSM 10068 TaxID=1123282 RepID=A0A1M5ZAZ3_9FIRM|nr:class I SAM-dependent methyltransferase [Sporobacter termitidis]SHI21369.1 Methyltransferase domain-containing protein [Sporobacter termitidis DSM 10068]
MSNIYETPFLNALQDASMHPGGLRLTDRAARLAELTPGMLVADIGCGAGVTAAFLSSKHRLSMIGLEISSALVDAGLKRYPGLRLIRWDCGTLPFEDGCLDGVVIECALSVIGRTEAILSECARALKTTGTLIISDVFLRAEAPAAAPLTTAEGLTRLLKKTGFDVAVSEDHTPALKTYLAELREQSHADFDTGSLLCAPRAGARPKLSELSYTLIIARKN